MSGYSKQCFIVWVILFCLYDVHNMTQQKTTCCSCFALKDQCASDDIYWQKMYEIKTKTDTRITESSQIRTSSTFSGKKFHVPFGTQLFWCLLLIILSFFLQVSILNQFTVLSSVL